MYENSFTVDQPSVKEAVKIFYLKRPLLITEWILSIILVLMGCIMFYSGLYSSGILFGLLLPGILILILLFRIHLNQMSVYRSLLESNHGNEPVMKYRFEEREILIEVGDSPMSRVPYEGFLRMYETPRLFILLTQYQQIIYIRKDSFRRGDPDSFRGFIQSRGITFRPPALGRSGVN